MLEKDIFAGRPLAAISGALRRREVTAEQLTRSTLARIEALNPKLEAVTEVNAEQAIAAAEGIDRLIRAGMDPGPLAGLPVLVKDLYQVKGFRITAGSRLDIQDLVPTEEGFLIQKLKQAGCIIVAKTRTTEFAMGGFNLSHPLPWNPSDLTAKRMTGGSSHGSAVALAAGLGAFTLGSDTGGSVRQPAAFAGVFGYKAGRDYWPTDGVFPMSPSLDSLGIFTRSAQDAAWIVAALGGGVGSSTAGLAGLRHPRSVSGARLAIPRNHFFDHCDTDVRQAFDKAVQQLADAGALITEIEIPEVVEIDAVFGAMVPADVLGFLGRDRFMSGQNLVDPVVWHRTSAAFDLLATDYLRFYLRYQQIAKAVNARLAGVDAWLSPTTPNVAPLAAGFDSIDKVAQFNRVNTGNVRPGNLFDQCGTTLPLVGATTGLPVGFQVMGKTGDDEQLLALSVAIEAVIGQGRVADMTSFI